MTKTGEVLARRILKHKEAVIALTSHTVLSCTTVAKAESVTHASTCYICVRLLTYKGS